MSQRPLSKAQRVQIGIQSTAAWKAQSALGQIELPGDMASESKTARMKFWVHQQIASTTQRVCSASDMMDDEYLAVKAHFQTLAGHADHAYDTAHRETQGAACHRDPGCEYVRQIQDWMSRAGYQTGYMIAIMKAKFKVSELTRLSEWQLKQLHATIVNRCRAKLGLGDTKNRDKKQREERQAKPAEETPPKTPQRERTYHLKPRPSPTPQADSDADPF